MRAAVGLQAPAERSISDAELRGVILDALTAGRSQDEVSTAIRPYDVEGSTFPTAVRLELAADAYLAFGSSRLYRLQIDGLAERMRFPRSTAVS